MTALCGGGTSSTKSGVAQTVIYTTSSLASVLNNKGGAWALLLAPLLGVLAYDATNLCSTDPPAAPTFTQADYNVILDLSDPVALATALGKLADLVKIAIWYDICECDSVATPAQPPALLLPPAGVPAPVAATSAPCSSIVIDTIPERELQIQSGIAHDEGPNATHPELFPAGARLTVKPNRSAFWGGIEPNFWTFVAIDPAWDQLELRYSSAVGDHNNMGIFIDGYNQSTNNTHHITNTQFLMDGSAASRQGVVTAQASSWSGDTHLTILANVAPGAAQPALTLDATMYCSGLQGTAAGAPCVADPAVLALLQQIMALTLATRSDVELIQRQGVPFGYIAGTVHAGLTGSGSFAVQGLLGLLIEVTTLPGYIGRIAGSPERLFDVGWVGVGTGDGYQHLSRIDSAADLWFPSAMGAMTQVGYSVSPNVVVRITELEREP